METIDLYIDSDCKLCAKSVQYLNKGISKKYWVRVYGIQTSTVQMPHVVSNLQSVGMLKNGKWLFEWKVVQQALKMRNSFITKILFGLSFIIPSSIGNNIYRFIAKRRYRWSNRHFKNTCLLPSAFYPHNPTSRIEIMSDAFQSDLLSNQKMTA